MGEPSQEPESNLKNGVSASGRAALISKLLGDATRLVGLILAVNELMIRDEIRNPALLICGVLLVGAEGVETITLHTIDRLFGRGS